MKVFRYKDFRDGDWYEARVNGIDSALHAINEKIARNMPLETVDADKLKANIASININCSRGLTAKEANTLVFSMKQLVIQEINKADKYYVDRSQKIKKDKKGE